MAERPGYTGGLYQGTGALATCAVGAPTSRGAVRLSSPPTESDMAYVPCPPCGLSDKVGVRHSSTFLEGSERCRIRRSLSRARCMVVPRARHERMMWACTRARSIAPESARSGSLSAPRDRCWLSRWQRCGGQSCPRASPWAWATPARWTARAVWWSYRPPPWVVSIHPRP